MRGRSFKRIALAVAVALAAGCAPRAVPVGPPQAADGLGTVHLQLEGFGDAPRSTQVAPTFARARVRFDGAAFAAEKAVNVSFRLGVTELTVKNVPAGPNVAILVEGLDASDRPMPGARYGTVVDLSPTATVSAKVGPVTTPRADVVLALLAMDRAASRSAQAAFSARLDDETLQTRLDAERSRLGLVHPALFDAGAIARAIATGASPTATTPLVPPSDLSAYARSPGRVRIRLTGVPVGSRAAVWLDDPISPKQQNLANGGYEILPVAPGAWTLSAEAPGGFLVSVPVTVAAGLTTAAGEVVLDLSRWESLPGLTKPLAAAACAPMVLNGTPTLVMAGGVDAVPAPVPGPDQIPVTRYATDSCYAFDGSRAAPLPPLPAPVSFATGVTVDNGDLYVLGGLSETGARTNQVYRFDGRAWSAVATASTPFAGAVGFASGTSVYVFGGSLGLSGLVYDTASKQFRSAPDMAIVRPSAASAVYQGRFYVFGGGEQTTPLPGSEVFDPATGGWRPVENLPAARHGARAVVLGDRIYVIGGASREGLATSRVDVYTPATNTWASFGSLKTPRAAAQVGVLDGRIYVLGGSDGLLASIVMGTLDKPAALGAIEAMTP